MLMLVLVGYLFRKPVAQSTTVERVLSVLKAVGFLETTLTQIQVRNIEFPESKSAVATPIGRNRPRSR